MTATVRITLPFPVSVNAMYSRARNRVFRSKRYRGWATLAGRELAKQKPPHLKGPVGVRLEFVAPDARKRDADNLVKSVLDLLVAHQVIEEDNRTIVRWAHPEWVAEGAPCTVMITALEAA